MPEALRADPRLLFPRGPDPRRGSCEGAQPWRLQEMRGLAALRRRGLPCRTLPELRGAAAVGVRRLLAEQGSLFSRWGGSGRGISSRTSQASPTSPWRPFPGFGPPVVCGAGPLSREGPPLHRRVAESRTLSVLACDTALSPLLDVRDRARPRRLPRGPGLQSRRLHQPGRRRGSPPRGPLLPPRDLQGGEGREVLTFVRITPSRLPVRASRPPSRLAPALPALPPLGSVGVHAVHVAGSLARGPLLAAGLDFSFEPGKTHASGCPSLLAEERRLGRLTRWPGQYAASSGRPGWAEAGPPQYGLRPIHSLPPTRPCSDELSKPGPPVYDLRDSGLPSGRRLSFDRDERLSPLGGLMPPPGASGAAVPGVEALRSLDQGAPSAEELASASKESAPP